MAKKPNPDVLKHLHFVAYDLPTMTIDTEEKFKLLASLSFKIPRYTVWELNSQMNSNISMSNETIFNKLTNTLVDWRANSTYGIDGLVIAYPKYEAQEIGKNPVYTIAFKTDQDSETLTSQVTNIDWKQSKDNKLKPTIIIEPVELGGVTIQRITGNNARYIVENKIGFGSIVEVIRSGEVIPKIHSVVLPSDENQMVLPTIKYKWSDNQVDFIVENDNPHAILLFFANTLNIKYLSEGTIKKLVEAGVKHPEDLISFSLDNFKTLPGFGDKNANKVYNSIQNSIRDADLISILVASNSFGGGLSKKRLETIFSQISISQTLISVINREVDEWTFTKSQISNIKGFSDILAKHFIDGLIKTKVFLDNSPIICQYCLDKLLVANKNNKMIEKDNKYNGIHIVPTGWRDKTILETFKHCGGSIVIRLPKNNVFSKKSKSNKLSSKEKNRISIPIIEYETFIKK